MAGSKHSRIKRIQVKSFTSHAPRLHSTKTTNTTASSATINSTTTATKNILPPSQGLPPQHSIDRSDSNKDKKVSRLQSLSNKVTGALETGFSRLGFKIGTHPWRFIIGCIIAALLTSLGLLAFEEVTAAHKLWIPEGAQVITDLEWIDVHYPSTVRHEQIIAKGLGGDVLTPSSIQALLDIYQESLTISTSNGVTLSNVCIKAGSNCTVYSVLEVWSYDSATIQALTKTQILSDINATLVSPSYGNTIDFTNYLGAITKDANGNIIAAQSAIMTWLTDGSESMELTTKSWETQFIALGQRQHSSLDHTYVYAAKSFDEELEKSFDANVILLLVGYSVVIIFVLLVLGKLNLIEHKIWLTFAGFLSVGFSLLVSIGVSSAIQQRYSMLHNVLPFLLLGLGVDDMFVIMGALNSLTPEEAALDIPQKMSKVLRHAGVSITVTSFTDFVAFMIGATTILPGLRSFCIYCGVGIISLYIFQSLFFTSCLTLDLYRIADNRDACCYMIKHKTVYKTNSFNQTQVVPLICKGGLANVVTMLPVKIAIIIIGLVMFGYNTYAFTKLEIYFQPTLFLPSDSYAHDFISTRGDQFPDSGATGYVYCGPLNYWSKNDEFDNLDMYMQTSKYIKNGTTDSWFYALTSWLSETSDADIIAMLDANKYPSTRGNFVNLTYRLANEENVRTSSYLKFNSTTTITASRIPFQFIAMSDADTEIDALDSTRELVEYSNLFTSECFPFSEAFLAWETNKVIRTELYRNLGIALACVFLITLILIANVLTSVLVLFGVTATLIDVAGSMHLWGLTIETVTSIVLIVSIGLAVDYSAHIGHMFMTVKGSRHERIKETIGEMGPSVFYGGFSTLLAFLPLSNSTSYMFVTFFKVNFLVVFYGLFHGLLFIPVVLSWIGPEPYPTAERVYNHGKGSDNSITVTVIDIENEEGGEGSSKIFYIPNPESSAKCSDVGFLK